MLYLPPMSVQVNIAFYFFFQIVKYQPIRELGINQSHIKKNCLVLAFFLVLGLFFLGTRRTSSQVGSYILDIVTQNIPMFTCIYNISYWTRWEPKHLARSSESLVIRVIQNKSSYSFVINIRELELNEAHRYTIGCIRKFYSGSDMILREKLFAIVFAGM